MRSNPTTSLVNRMSLHRASAPGKLILVGEHAVVYGRPAIALPLGELRATAELSPLPAGAGLVLDAPDLASRWALREAPGNPLSDLARRTLELLGSPTPDALLTLRSAIPVASGMGSGAAVGTALVRALLSWAGQRLEPAQVSALVYESERFFHGTPSGLDNTVVAYEQPVWFCRNPQPPHLIELLALGGRFRFIVGDTGIRSETRLPVGEVRRRWQVHPARYEALFDTIAAQVVAARGALERGDARGLGLALNTNQQLLATLGVSSSELEHLIDAARSAGALGAKLSGGGWGGVMLALVDASTAEPVAAALRQAGATRVLTTTLAAQASSAPPST
jgi:mevalonate kinase